MTLIELMVALAIGMFLMIGAITVFMQSRTTFRVTESLARMQENGRFALEALEPDIRMAHYWGLSTMTTSVTNRVAPAAGNLFGRPPTRPWFSTWPSPAATTATGSAARRLAWPRPTPTRSSSGALPRMPKPRR
jgi:type IV pilus assembly protein PilW